MRPGVEQVWLSGERSHIGYLLDVASGKVVQSATVKRSDGVTAGVGRRCGRRFVAVYVAADPEGVILQVGARRFPLDGSTEVLHTTRLLGIISSLRVSHPDAGAAKASQFTLRTAFGGGLYTAWDTLSSVNGDFLADVADVAYSPARRELMLKVKDPAGGPWED
jgi:hypothetical protein